MIGKPEWHREQMIIRAKLLGCLLMTTIAMASVATAQTTANSPVDATRLAAARKLFVLLKVGDRAGKLVDQVFGAVSDAALKQTLSTTSSNDPNFGERQRRLALVKKTEETALMNEIMP